MSIKAGRVGVNPKNVDELGNIVSGGSEIPEHTVSDAGKVLSVNNENELEFITLDLPGDADIIRRSNFGSGFIPPVVQITSEITE